MTGRSASWLRWTRWLMAALATVAGALTVVAAIWIPSSSSIALLPLTERDFEREMQLGNIYGYGDTVPVTLHGSSVGERHLRASVGDTALYTGFGIARSASASAEDRIRIRWRASGTAGYVSVELQATPPDLPGRATWNVVLSPPGGEWSEASIPLSRFKWNVHSNPTDWAPRPLDATTLTGVSMTLPPGGLIQLDLAAIDIESSTNRLAIILGMLLLTGALCGLCYALTASHRRRQVVQALQVSEEDNRRLQEQLVQAQKMEAVGRLAGGIAHDFNNLLTGIIGACDLAQRRIDDEEEVAEWLGRIRELSNRAAGITGQLLTFSRGQPLQRSPVSANAIIDECVSLAGHMLGHDVHVSIEAEAEHDTILADRTRVLQVLINLAVNARDAMPDGGQLTFRTDNVDVPDGSDPAPGRCLRLQVRDTGHGIHPPALKSSIFEPFFTTKEAGKGTGLGLAIVYGVVRQHGGTVEVDNRPEGGAEFTILLPVHGGLPETEQVVALPETATDEAILIVEDDAAVRHMVEALLQDQGYRVVAAGSPGEAFDCFSTHDGVDLLLCDISMPGESGPALYKRLRASNPELPVLFMTGFADPEGNWHDDLDPAWPVITKPFRPEQLLRQVRSILDDDREP